MVPLPSGSHSGHIHGEGSGRRFPGLGRDAGEGAGFPFGVKGLEMVAMVTQHYKCSYRR